MAPFDHPWRPIFAACALPLLGSCLPSSSEAQAIRYAGKVVDEAGKGIAAATVALEGSSYTVLTDAAGAFDLNGSLASVHRPGPRFAASRPLETLLHRLDGRVGPVFPASGWWGSQRAAAGMRLAGGSAATEAPAEVTSPSPLAKASAAYALTVTKAGYFQGRFSQSKPSVLTLSLSLMKAPDSAGGYAAEKKLCMDEANRYRATLGLPAVAWSKALEAFADTGARYDAGRNQAHAHFGAAGRNNPSDAENEIPGWPLRNYRTVAAVVTEGIKMMWDEGPGGGHYENIKGSHTQVGCGIHVTATGNVWVVQDFK